MMVHLRPDRDSHRRPRPESDSDIATAWRRPAPTWFMARDQKDAVEEEAHGLSGTNNCVMAGADRVNAGAIRARCHGRGEQKFGKIPHRLHNAECDARTGW